MPHKHAAQILFGPTNVKKRLGIQVIVIVIVKFDLHLHLKKTLGHLTHWLLYCACCPASSVALPLTLKFYFARQITSPSHVTVLISVLKIKLKHTEATMSERIKTWNQLKHQTLCNLYSVTVNCHSVCVCVCVSVIESQTVDVKKN